jgi:hypothetical protein
VLSRYVILNALSTGITFRSRTARSVGVVFPPVERISVFNFY